MATVAHLTQRFFESLWPAPPTPADDAWARQQLSPGERDLWQRMKGYDRRHAIGVARRVLAHRPDASAPVVAAALLHDVGKLDSGLGVFGRVAATLWRGVRGSERSAVGNGRIARYTNHPEIGRRWLEAADADPLTSAWAGEHHQPAHRWTVPSDVGAILKAADDD